MAVGLDDGQRAEAVGAARADSGRPRGPKKRIVAIEETDPMLALGPGVFEIRGDLLDDLSLDTEARAVGARRLEVLVHDEHARPEWGCEELEWDGVRIWRRPGQAEVLEKAR